MPSLEPYATERASEDAALLRLQRYARRRHQRLRSRRVDQPAVVASPYGEQRLLVPSKPVKNLLRRNERACLIIQSHARARAAWRAGGGGPRSADVADEAVSFWKQWLSTAGAEPSDSGWSDSNGLPDDPQEALQLQLPLSLPPGRATMTAAARDALALAVRDELCALLALRQEQLHVSCPSGAAAGGARGGGGKSTLVQLDLLPADDHPSVSPSQAALTLANLVGGDLNPHRPTSMPPQMIGNDRRLTSSEVRPDLAALQPSPHCNPRRTATLAALQPSPRCNPRRAATSFSRRIPASRRRLGAGRASPSTAAARARGPSSSPSGCAMRTRPWGCGACCRATARCVSGRGAPLVVGVEVGVVGVVVAALPSRGSRAAAAQG